MELFGTLGPACHERDRLKRMLEAGMTGIRLNLSHGSLEQRKDWIRSLHEAEEAAGIHACLLMDLKGRELRIGRMEPRELAANSTVFFGTQIPAERALTDLVKAGDILRLDDGHIILQALEPADDHSWRCRVVQGGVLAGCKSVSVDGARMPAWPLCQEDLENLDQAVKFGVTALMVPFVQSRQDLEIVRKELDRRGLDLRLYAKIENEAGCRNLEDLSGLADMIVIARGDLGQQLGLVRLPAVQKDLEARCRKAGKPWMVVTELLASMTENPQCTRAEASDVFWSVARGARALMLTNETAAGRYPEEAMKTLCALAAEGLKAQNPAERGKS